MRAEHHRMPSHTISVLVENEFGVLARVAGLFSSRGFNIESLDRQRGPAGSDGLAHRAGGYSGDDQILEQINKQLNKLVSVIKVTDFKDVEHHRSRNGDGESLGG